MDKLDLKHLTRIGWNYYTFKVKLGGSQLDAYQESLEIILGLIKDKDDADKQIKASKE